MVAFFSSLHAEDLSTLDRGHRILIEQGLQIQALTFGTEDPSWWDEWEQSRFTAASLQGRSPVGQNLSGNKWATWIANSSDPAQSIPADAAPFRPDLSSWQYKDEQDLTDPNEVAQAKAWIDAYRPQLPHTLLYTNQFGIQTSVAAMQDYMRDVQPDMVYFDSYPFRNGPSPIGGSPWWLYQSMVKYRQLGLAGNDGTGQRPIPYGMWLQTFRFATFDGQDSAAYWLPSESELRLNQFAAWTFGYTHVSAFTYNDVFENATTMIDSPFFDGPLHATVQPTDAFYRYAETNRQSLNLGNALVRLLSTDVRLVPTTAYGSAEFAELFTHIPLWDANANPFITGIQAENLGSLFGGMPGDVLVGYFTPLLESFDGPDYENEIYFMITNGLSGQDALAAEARQSIVLDFDFGTSGIERLLRLSRETGTIEAVELESLGGTSYRLTLELDGGTGDLFKFDTGAPFVGVAIPESPAITLSGSAMFTLLVAVFTRHSRQRSP